MRAALLAGLLATGTVAVGQAQGKGAAKPAVGQTATADTDFVTTQVEMLKLLKLSPTLTEVLERDPSLLSNQEYVEHNNPQLAQFLQAHPEIARNPGFYLYTNLPPGRDNEQQALDRKIWPEEGRSWQNPSQLDVFMDKGGPFLVFVGVLGALLWLIRTLLDNRRWGRIFKLQTEVHGKLIEKFGNNQELLTYMDTEAGKRFLEAAPIPVNFEPEQRLPNALARVLMPLQVGIVMVLLGLGLILLRGSLPDYKESLLLLGTLTLMPGLGFMISAGVTWLLAGRLGMIPERTKGFGGHSFDERNGQ
jgi:hypothetical protein